MILDGHFPQIPAEKAQRAVSLLGDVINVGFPAQITLDGDAKVLCIINGAKGCAMNGVVSFNDVFFSCL